MDNPKKALPLLLLGLVMAVAAIVRFGVAQLSAGPDVAQFWGFAEAFRLYGLDFYRYAEARLDWFPFPYWGYVYPPVWLLILALSMLAAPSSLATSGMVDASWRLAMKTPIILADLAIGVLLFYAISGSRYRKLLFATLWLLNPASWYNSSVFGQFDALATAFLLGSIVLLERGRDRWAFLLAILAGMTKQLTLIPVAFILVACTRQMSWRRLLSNVALMAGIALVISLPFIITGNISDYLRSVIFPAQEPDYQYPPMYVFNAAAAILTHLHDVMGWETVGLMHFSVPLLGVVMLAALAWCYFKKIDMLRGALIGILLFIVIFYRINYQYLVVVIALALLIAARTTYLSERVVALGLAIFPAGWLWMINVATWFVYLNPSQWSITPFLEKLGLTHQGLPNWAYLAFTSALTVIILVYIFLALFRWRRPLNLANITLFSKQSLSMPKTKKW
jgi:uncharacterized membrane protein